MIAMLKCYLDSNVLIGYSYQESIFRGRSLDLMEFLMPGKYSIYISPLAIDEFLHSFSFLLKRNGVTNKEILKLLHQSLSDIISFPNIFLVNPSNDKNNQLKVLEYMKEYNLKPRDAYHLLIMKEKDIDYFATFDTDFKEVFRKGVVENIAYKD